MVILSNGINHGFAFSTLHRRSDWACKLIQIAGSTGWPKK